MTKKLLRERFRNVKRSNIRKTLSGNFQLCFVNKKRKKSVTQLYSSQAILLKTIRLKTTPDLTGKIDIKQNQIYDKTITTSDETTQKAAKI